MSFEVIIKFPGVGKSCILSRVMDNNFKEEHNVTIGVEFDTLVIKVDGKIVKLQILENAGLERFKFMEISNRFLSFCNNLMFSANEISNLIDR